MSDTPLLLAVETSGPLGSVAVGRPGVTFARAFLEERGAHASRLVPALDEVLASSGRERGEVTGVVVGSGPGSFTGVRVAAAAAKGLAFALEAPLWAVSSLAAAAVSDRLNLPAEVAVGEGPEPPEGASDAPRYVLFDARGNRVYAACYRVTTSGGAEEDPAPVAVRMEELVTPRATDLDEVLAGPVPAGAVFVGSGARRHEEAIRSAGHEVAPRTWGLPTADGLLYLMAEEPERPPLDDARGWQPDYLKAWSGGRTR